MQPLTGAGVTETQARAHLSGASSVRYGRGAEILAADLTVLEDIAGDLLGGSISRSMRADIHGTCSLVLARDFDYGKQLIRPYMTMTAAGVTSKWYEGAYVGRKPTSTYGDSLPSNAVDGSDRLFLLNRPVGDAYTILGPSSGTNLVANPSFEVDTSGWETNTFYGTYGTATLARSTTRATDGSASLLVTWPTSSSSRVNTSHPVIAGTTYRTTADVWVSAGTPDVRLDAPFEWPGGGVETSTKGAWVTLSAVRTAPSSGFWHPSVITVTAPTSGQQIWVDNVQVVQVSGGILDAVRQVIIDAGFAASTVLLDGTASASTLPVTKVWPLIADTTSTTTAVTAADAVTSGGSNGTTWLQIINELLGMVNYRGLWCDWNGLFRSEPYATPATRPVEMVHSFDADDAIVARQRSSVQDYSAVPNVWIFQQSNIAAPTTTTDAYGNTVDVSPPEPVEGAGQYTVTNTSDGPSSINARGGLRFTVLVPLDAADQASLVSQGDTRVAADKRVTKVLTVNTSPFPAAWHWDIYTYADAAMGGLVKVQSASWTLDLGTGNTPPADMQHSWEVVA